MFTLRIKYTKEHYMKFLGHLELMKLFERVFRLHKLPMKFSEGFNPHPKMTFASPLSVGYSSKGELMEVILDQEVPLDQIKAMKFPAGIEVLDAKYVETKQSLMGGIAFSEYLLKMEYDDKPIFNEHVSELLESFAGRDEIPYEKTTKKGKVKINNAKEQLLKLEHVYSDDHEIILRGILQTSSNGNLNPELLCRLFAQYMNNEQALTGVKIERLSMFEADEAGTLNPLFDME